MKNLENKINDIKEEKVRLKNNIKNLLKVEDENNYLEGYIETIQAEIRGLNMALQLLCD
jgi:hypothetical protein